MDFLQSTSESSKRRLPIVREGIPFIISGLLITGFFMLMDLMVLSALGGLLTLFMACFFRDPERRIPNESKAVLTPADGKVVDLRDVEPSESPFLEPACRVSIFMSIFNVHVNRIPVSGKVINVEYSPGRFIPANKQSASMENEQNKITLETEGGQKVAIVQVAGLIARRIACWIREGEFVRAGDRFGLIRFGSRVDLYLPSNTQILIEKYSKVKAGETIIGYLS
jgi:phosphatidylserine decarboxylase